MIPYEDATTLSRLYHLNSEPWLNAEAYAAAAYRVDYKEMLEAGERVALPAPQESHLLKLLQTRASCRQYMLRPMPLARLATLVGAAESRRFRTGRTSFSEPCLRRAACFRWSFTSSPKV